MKWKVVGADRPSGKVVTRIYDVISEEAAQQYAHEDGILVSSVELVPERAPKPVEYASRWPEDDGLPKCTGLRIAGRVIGGFAALYYGVATLFGIHVIKSVSRPNPLFSATLPDYASEIGIIFTIAMIGGVLHGISSACFALRDIARNSWK